MAGMKLSAVGGLCRWDEALGYGFARRRPQKRTSVAKAVIIQGLGGTAEAVPFVEICDDL
jgi:hypothetical protein